MKESVEKLARGFFQVFCEILTIKSPLCWQIPLGCWGGKGR